MQNQNKTLAYSCVEVLSRFIIMYGERKERWRAKQPRKSAGAAAERGGGGGAAAAGGKGGASNSNPSWFDLPAEHRGSPDFFSLSNAAIVDIEERQTWVEYKVLRQYQNMFQDALTVMCDLCYVIAVNTRRIAEAASARHDFRAWDLCIKASLTLKLKH